VVVVNATPRTLYTQERDPVPIVQEVGWAPEPVWTGAENLAPHRDSIPGPSSPLRGVVHIIAKTAPLVVFSNDLFTNLSDIRRYWVNQTQVTEWEKQFFVMFDIHMAQLSVSLVTTP